MAMSFKEMNLDEKQQLPVITDMDLVSLFLKILFHF